MEIEKTGTPPPINPTQGGNIRVIELKKTDAELAEIYRRGAEDALKSLLGVINEARSHGLIVQFQFGEDGFGRQAIAALNILKKL